jgi:hypothetical protein
MRVDGERRARWRAVVGIVVVHADVRSVADGGVLVRVRCACVLVRVLVGGFACSGGARSSAAGGSLG